MRRPLKPFVTEYKASSRRQPQSLSEPPAQSVDRAVTLQSRADLDSESSYEAALRAADALFSGGPKAGNLASESAAEASSGPTAETASPKSAGRILRVIDEAPPPELAALEAAYAPKRRGRKPGSKNKPKIPPIDAVPLAPVIAPPPLPMARIETATTEELRTTSPKRNGRLVPIRTGKRLSWVRDKLGPGEEWKRRRLPRICW